MYKRRLIPVLFLKNGWMVRSESFLIHQIIGEPTLHAERMRQWNVDELMVLDISDGDNNFEHNRDDHKYKPVNNLLQFIERFSYECNMPLTFGGNIKSLQDIKLRIEHGADKISINSFLYSMPNMINDAVRIFGKQAIVASIDCKLMDSGEYSVFTEKGKKNINLNPKQWAKEVEKIGVGEILLQFIDRDGKSNGYDVEVINQICNSVNIPVIACSGAGNQRQILECFNICKAEAIAAGNIFHFTENAYPRIKSFLASKREDIRSN